MCLLSKFENSLNNLNIIYVPGIVVYAFNPSNLEAEAGRCLNSRPAYIKSFRTLWRDLVSKKCSSYVTLKFCLAGLKAYIENLLSLYSPSLQSSNVAFRERISWLEGKWEKVCYGAAEMLQWLGAFSRFSSQHQRGGSQIICDSSSRVSRVPLWPPQAHHTHGTYI